METVQQRGVQLQGRQAWPFQMMATSTTACFDSFSYSSSGSSSSGSGDGNGGGDDCFVLGWEQQPPPPPPFGCFGVLAAADVHELFPLCTTAVAGMDSPLPVSSALALPLAPPPPTTTAAALDAVAAVVPEDLDDLLLNFWDASCCYDANVGAHQQAQAAVTSSCAADEKSNSIAAVAAGDASTTTDSFFPSNYGDDLLGSIFSAGPTLAENAATFQSQAAAEPPSSSSSGCHAGPRAGDGTRAQAAAATPSAARAPPPLPRSSASSSSSRKRSTREESDQAECSQSKRRKEASSPSPSPAAGTGVVCPFALLKPDGLDGGATLADINARILMRPSRPVRHPVGEFACAPRVSADAPGISGKAVSSFTRLHTPGRGTITIVRTRG
ncbi:hypothetical protein ACP70R_006935 [Stipagrostis hirtigluma subsp. patula]